MKAANATVEVSTGDRVCARSKFRYGDRYLEQGEVFELAGALNDRRLAGFGYLEKLEKGAKIWPCSACNIKEFVSEPLLRAHQRRVHGGLPG